MRDLKTAAVCMESDPWNYKRNLEHMEKFVHEASDNSADIICFPELAITGYILENPEEIYSHTVSNEIIGIICNIARMTNIIVLVGMIEIDRNNMPYISQIAAGPEGLIGTYRKSHLSPAEKGIYTQGETIRAISYQDITFGIQLCFESHFPEISTILALQGAEIIFMPHASPRGTPEEKLKSWLRHLPGRAFDNSLFILACNQIGQNKNGLDFPGTALMISPSGNVIQSYTGGKEKVLYAEIKGEELNEIKNHRMRYFLPNRRPELYHEIIDKKQ